LWGQFFLFLTHFNRLHQKKQFFFGFGKKMHEKGIFVTHTVLTYKVEGHSSNWRCRAEN